MHTSNKNSTRVELSSILEELLDLKMLIELKRTSNDLKDKLRLPVLKETLRQLEKS
jgi:hypothetical protein